MSTLTLRDMLMFKKALKENFELRCFAAGLPTFDEFKRKCDEVYAKESAGIEPQEA